MSIIKKPTSCEPATDASRRGFFKSTALAAGAVAAANLIVPRVHAAGDDDIKVGLVGCGGRGRGAIVNAMKADYRVKVTALADLFPDALEFAQKTLAKQAKEQWAVDDDHCFSGIDAYKQLIPEVDVVLLCTPPHFRPAHLEAAINAGATLNLESENEGRRALLIAERLGKTPRLAIRVNPDFELRGSGMKMGGGAKPFGLDAERVPALARELIAAGAEWRGLHIFTGSQALDAEAIAETQGNVLDLADSLAKEIGAPLPKLNMGGGLGIPYFHGDAPVDLELVGKKLRERLEDLPPALTDTQLCIELGRYLVGEAGVYLCKVLDRKISHGETYLVTDGGLHHQLAASGNFGTVVRRNYPVAIASRFGAAPTEVQHVVGCLCTPLDRLADKAELPRADVGDLVAVFCAGAYGASASPSNFLGQGPAREMLV